ncbi:MAG: ATP-binding protein [Deltaproteobacteria bacterium]
MITFDEQKSLLGVGEDTGRTAEAFRSGDWSSLLPGPISSWPSRLLFALELMFAAEQPVFVCWGEHHLLFHNDGCLPFGGGRVLLGRPLAEAWPEIAAVMVPVCERLHATGRGEILENQHLLLNRRPREEVCLAFSCIPLQDEDGAIGGMMVMELAEIAAAVRPGYHPESEGERLPAPPAPMPGECGDEEQQLLVESESRLRAIIDYAPAVIYVKDLCFNYMLANEEFARITGTDRQGLQGRDDFALFPVEAAERFRADDKRVLATGMPFETEEEVSQKDGLHTYFTVKFPLVDDLGNTYAIAGISTDITDRKRGEDELRAIADELARSNKELEQFAYIVSHDLREPLRTIGGFLNLIQRRYGSRLDHQAKELIHFAVDGAERLDHMITDLLEYSRVQRQEPVLGSVDLFDIYFAVIENLKALIEETDAHISHDPLPVITGDASQLTRLLQNLIGNAIKFRGDSPPEIHIGISRCDNGWLFAVRDNGIGIQAEFVDRIFQVFQRLHTQKEYPGSGIGLAICRKIVERHGGRIWVESRPGEGTTFYFTITDLQVGKA